MIQITDASHIIRLLILVAVSLGMISLGAAQGQYGAKGQPEMLYVSDSDRDDLYLVTGSSGNQTALDGVNLDEFETQSFQACAYYVQLDPRQWDTAGPWDVDCYDKQEFQSLIDQGYFTDLGLQLTNRGINQ